jgi:Cytokinin dehydrogenase 1, FAD and cytokinin binding
VSVRLHPIKSGEIQLRVMDPRAPRRGPAKLPRTMIRSLFRPAHWYPVPLFLVEHPTAAAQLLVQGALVPTPSGGFAFRMDLAKYFDRDRPADDELLAAANKATYRRVTAGGGTLDPVSALPLRRREWRDHLGPAFAQLHAAKQSFDPRNTLTPAYEIF